MVWFNHLCEITTSWIFCIVHRTFELPSLALSKGLTRECLGKTLDKHQLLMLIRPENGSVGK